MKSELRTWASNQKTMLATMLATVWLFISIFFSLNVASPFKAGFNAQLNGSVPDYLTNKRGGGGGGGGSGTHMLGIIAAGVGGTFGFLFLLIIGGQIGGTSGIYGNLPASNITAITGNIGKAVVTGSQFVVLIFLGAGVAVAAAMIFLALAVFKSR